MGFVNQFPYSDFHELNLDWLIKTVKETETNIKTLQDEFAKIIILTEDQIQAMIDAAIATNNIELYNKLTQLYEQITAEYKSYCNAQINDLKVYVDAQDIYYYELNKAYSDNNLAISEAYTDNKVLTYTMMVNPITGEYEDVRLVVNDIVSYFHTADALTAAEYDALDLTASAYDAYELTAYDYDFNGKIRLT